MREAPRGTGPAHGHAAPLLVLVQLLAAIEDQAVTLQPARGLHQEGMGLRASFWADLRPRLLPAMAHRLRLIALTAAIA